MAEDEKFMSRWARRKAENREGSLIEDDVTTQVSEVDDTIDQATLTDDAEASGEDPDDHPALGIDIEKLDYESDFTVFMHEKVPQAIRRQALRHLWATNPILANVDGLNDYDEDFTDAATVVEGLKAAYDEACARRKAAEDAEAAKAKGAPEPETDDEQDDADSEDEAAIAEASGTEDAAEVAEVDAEDEDKHEDLEDGTDEA